MPPRSTASLSRARKVRRNASLPCCSCRACWAFLESCGSVGARASTPTLTPFLWLLASAAESSNVPIYKILTFVFAGVALLLGCVLAEGSRAVACGRRVRCCVCVRLLHACCPLNQTVACWFRAHVALRFVFRCSLLAIGFFRRIMKLGYAPVRLTEQLARA